MSAAERPPQAPPGHNPVIGLLGGAVLLLGLVPSLAILGVPRLAPFENLWRTSFGILAIPIAFGLVAVGSGLLSRRFANPWRLPWGRALAVELLALSALALLALAAAPDAVPPGGSGGRIGWALAAAAEEAAGRVWAIALWLGAGILATLWSFRVGAATIRGWLGSEESPLGGEDGAPDAPSPDPAVQRPMPTGHPTKDPSRTSPAGAEQGAGGRAVAERAAQRGADVDQGQPAGDATARGQPSRIITGSPRRADVPGTLAGRDVGRAPGTASARAAEPSSGRGAGSAPGSASQPAAEPTSGRGGVRPPAPPPSQAPAAAPTPARAPRTSSKRRPPTVRRAMGQPTTARRVARGGALPEIALLGEDAAGGADADVLRRLATRLEETLAALGAPVQVTDIEQGPTVARFLLVPGYVERGGERRRVPIARITAVRNDLALALSVPTLRIEAPVAGRPVIGIEIPNPESTAVSLRGLVQDRAFRQVAARSGLALAIGRAVSGAPIVADLERLPHLLIAGATGSGKSVGLAALLASLLFQNTPDALRLILIDPKRVELARFGRLPHLLAAMVTDVVEVVGVLQWLALEVDRRYRLFADVGARDLRAYNRRLPSGAAPLPRLVVVVDELADVMLRAPGEVEPLLTRLAQLARATGIHLIVATQRPSADVITGLIKANFPARLAFAVASAIDSRVILDAPGAESLLGRGDLLFQPPDTPRPIRGQGALISDDEIERLSAFWIGSPWPPPPRLAPWVDLIPPDDPEEALYDRAIELALAEPGINASVLQRRLAVGYPKARAIYDRLRSEGVLDRDPYEPVEPGAGPDPGDDPGAGGTGGAGRGESAGLPPLRRDDLGWVDDEFDG